ncbi:hypothetical protein LINGRAHAP2_LOCUS30164 [Linum grandiflorum]
MNSDRIWPSKPRLWVRGTVTCGEGLTPPQRPKIMCWLLLLDWWDEGEMMAGQQNGGGVLQQQW